jgi:hypothetical protein
MRRVTAGGLAACWVLLATVGHAVPDRLFMLLLGATMVLSTSAAVRGPEWWAAYRLGREVERSRWSAAIRDQVVTR